MELLDFLTRKKQDHLIKIYKESSEEIHNLMDKLYSCAFRFNLTDKQTIFLIEESISTVNVSIELMEDNK